MKDKSPGEIKFSGPGTYHIQVMGKVSNEIWNNFNGEAELIKETNGQVITSLKIHVRDQAELAGLIKMLYDWQHVLLMIKIEGRDEEMKV